MVRHGALLPHGLNLAEWNAEEAVKIAQLLSLFCGHNGRRAVRRGRRVMDANAIGFAVLLQLFMLVAIGVATWVQQMRG
jgi:hypothetical protein